MEYKNIIKFTADIHYKENTLKHLKKPMQEFIEDLKNTLPIITVIGGDYFDKRLGAEEEAYKEAIARIIEMAKYTKHLIFIKGTYSHDYDTLEILDSLKKIQKNIYYFDTLAEVVIENYKILIIPEEYPTDPTEYYKKSFSKKYDFVFGHGDIQGAKLHSGINNSMLKGFRFNLQELSNMGKWCLFGHIHKHQFLKENVVYPGSLARYKHGEEEAKGYLSLDIDNNILSFIEVEASAFETIIIKTEADLEKYKEYLESSIDKNFNIKLDKEMKHLKKDFKLMQFDSNIDFANIKEEDNNNELLYKDIESLNISEQFDLILETDILAKKIPKKNQSFINQEIMSKTINNIISDITLTKTLID